ncbi:MAG: adenosylhomocysteinase [Rhodoferax sp.]|nr:adenosylhomocysteinase [Actinomycetota bacterium]
MPSDETAAASPGSARIAYAARAMPVLRIVAAQLAAEQSLRGLSIAACLHVTPETACLLEALQAGGASVSLASANPLSAQDDVAAALRTVGVAVHAQHGADRRTYYAHLSAALDDAAAAAGPLLVLDDGCDLVTTLHTTRRELLPRVRAGVEDTSSGVVRLRQMARDGTLAFPMIAATSSATARLLEARHGTGQSTLEAVLRATHLLLAGRTVVVAGYGACGRGIAERAAGLGAVVVVTEVDPLRALEATLRGFRVLPMARALREADVVITATGNVGVVRGEHLELLKDGAVLANAGHFDVEIDVKALAAASVATHLGVRPGADEHVLADGRRVLLLAAGRVVNLAVAEGHPPAVMDMAFAEQAMLLSWLATAAATLARGVHPVPATLDGRVAALGLAALGVEVDSLSEAQRGYLSSWQQGS